MATRIEHRATFAHAAADVFAAHTEQRALRARLEAIGGNDPELREYETTADGVRYTLSQGIDAAKLPGIVRRIHDGDLTVRREHVWTDEGGRYSGTIEVHVADLPGRIRARTELTGQGAGSVLRTLGEVAVRVPLVGGKIEKIVAEQVTGLLAREADFTAQWLGDRS